MTENAVYDTIFNTFVIEIIGILAVPCFILFVGCIYHICKRYKIY